ncbi:FAD-binding oxidoreductase [Streptosporangium sp. NBC_01755]|uniref:FAD-dependent oxidoreductase n=1 Tax=unclassified Streptosporangium TaxID=2632669 RepID=UPI002DDB8BF1|nr:MULTISPECIES: FAD-dependent oxidoreductase [unclassified Streptosporangium]WSA27894.1 FAD-binding oxidoreductase [Streptosporangium sp. NBC_01810]WSD00634.1 FAD-binding oxidoreductase [Streptosporangium sp. NBC_01755]
MLRIAVVGGGIAGAMLAWRLCEVIRGSAVHLYTGEPHRRADASAASGGLTRAFEPDPALCLEAADSLAELHSNPELREWASYRETGSVYLLPGLGPGTEGLVELVRSRLPGSISLVGGEELSTRGTFRELPSGSVAVVEKRAGYLSPNGFRDRLLVELARSGAFVTDGQVDGITADAEVRPAEGSPARFDAVVVAAGAWTQDLLARTGLSDAGLRTKVIQYVLGPSAGRDPGAFVDETSGLYGRTYAEGRVLLGLPTNRWDITPGTAPTDPALTSRILDVAESRIGYRPPGRKVRAVTAVECYHPTGGLSLRPLAKGVYTFTGGSGGAGKTVLAASRTAARSLVRSLR